MIISTLQRFVKPILVLLIIFCSVLTIWTLITPPVLNEEVKKPYIYRSINYDYKIYPIDSILYPPGTGPLSSGETTYYTNLIEQILFYVHAEVIEVDENDGPVDDVELKVDFIISAPGQW